MSLPQVAAQVHRLPKRSHWFLKCSDPVQRTSGAHRLLYQTEVRQSPKHTHLFNPQPRLQYRVHESAVLPDNIAKGNTLLE